MIEPIMYLAIGFLVSMLFGLMILPLVHNRAVRLTTRRLEAATPLSMAEIQADKDQLRAEFAMSARRLEMSVEQLKNKTTSQLAELGKKTDAINRMKIELGEKNATIFSLEAREKAVKEQLRATEEEFAAKTEMLRSAEQALNDKQAELGKINHELSDRSMTADSRQVELVAVRTQIEHLKGRVGDAEKEFTATQARLAQERTESETATRELSDARSRVENLSQRVTDLDRQLIVQVKEAEMLGTRVNDLETRLADAGQAAGRTRIRKQSAQADQRDRRAHHEDLRTEVATLRAAAIRRRSKNCAARRPRSRSSFASPATSARNCSARSTRSSSRRKAPGPPSAWKTRCCASASTTSPPRSPSSRSSSRARIRRSRPCWRRNRPRRRAPAKTANDVTGAAHGAPRKAAARSPNASAPCSRTLPAPASKGRNSSAYTSRLTSRLIA